AIAAMVYLIARQFRTHSALAAMRAEKIEFEHTRLVAEAELLKKERLSVLGQFTATVAEELRNPLSAIRNTLFTMREIAMNSGLTLDRPIARIQRSMPATVTLIRQFEAGDVAVRIDADRLRRVVVNLIDNAAQALGEMTPGSGVQLISVRTATENA